mmetsp:Transcript_8548/g.12538  ORF Transcript_8548/g.12538 Transcript_8548/m.12538 type:complete len:334 (+) Transcript_8548:146-1147(+)
MGKKIKSESSHHSVDSKEEQKKDASKNLEEKASDVESDSDDSKKEIGDDESGNGEDLESDDDGSDDDDDSKEDVGDKQSEKEEEDVDSSDVQQQLEGKEEQKDGEGNDTKKKKKKIRKLSLKKTEDFNAKLRKRGVIYIARIPPRMGPAKIKTLMSEFGTVTRVYLVEEDKAAKKKRKKAAGGGSGGGKRYLEGWVEFESRKIAKQVGMSLNNTPITNYKRSVHYGDIWNVKYLRKFKWSHLTEKVAYERRVREQKLRIEMMSAKRENAAYASLVEAGKKLDRIEERRKKKNKRGIDEADGPDTKKRKFRQTKPVDGKDTSGAAKRAVLNALV